jgi:TIR domain
MKIFISWSGDLSEELGGKLRDWLPQVIQRVEPYFTPKDIDKGARWITDVTNGLLESRLGVICVTPDNMESAWIMFEAGAISTRFSQNKICPIVFGMRRNELRGPLFQFQAVEFDKGQIRGLVQSINEELGDDQLSEGALEVAFEKWWPDLDESIRSTIKNWKPKRPPEKSSDERHAEVLGLLHQISEMRREELKSAISEDIFVNLYANIDAALASQADKAGLLDALSMLARNVEFLHQRLFSKASHVERAVLVLDRIQGARSHPSAPTGTKHGSVDDEIPF